MAKTDFTNDDIVQIFNSVGFDTLEEAIQSLSLSKSFIDAGFTDPALFTPVLKRFKLLDQKNEVANPGGHPDGRAAEPDSGTGSDNQPAHRRPQPADKRD